MMAWSREVRASFVTSLRATVARPRHMLLMAVGFVVAGLVVMILLTIPAGLKSMAGRTGLRDIALVLPSGASNEAAGTFPAAQAALVGGLPGVAHGKDGQPLVAPQFVVNTRLVRRDGTTATVLVRGVTPIFWNVIGQSTHVVTGTSFRDGRDELIAGVAVARGFVSLDSGDVVKLRKQPWQVTGQFAAGGGFWESQLWGDFSALQSTYHAQGTVSVLWARLRSPEAFKVFSAALHDDPRMQGLYAIAQPNYYAAQVGFLRAFIRIVTVVVGITLGLGAILAVANALAMALEARERELAIQRAIGFRRAALAIALLAEVLLIAATCSGIALATVWPTLNGYEVGSSAASHAIQFRLRVDGNVIGWTIAYVCCIGVLAGTSLIVHAVRTPLADALKEE